MAKQKKQPSAQEKKGLHPVELVECVVHNKDTIDCEEAKKECKLSLDHATSGTIPNDSKTKVEILSGLEDCIDPKALTPKESKRNDSGRTKATKKKNQRPSQQADVPEVTTTTTTTTTRPTTSRTKFSKLFWHWILPIALMVLMALVAAALAVVLFGHFAQDKDDSGMSGIDQVDAIRHLDNIQGYLIESGVTLYEDFEHPDNSPQAQASEWLAWADPAQLSIPRSGARSKEVYAFVSRYILATIYFATKGQGWYNQYNFLSKDSVCAWQDVSEDGDDLTTFGVVCNDDGEVTEINLEGNGLDGFLPNEVTRLTTLQKIHVGSNEAIVGQIPSDLDELSHLEYLVLSRNRMTGTIPSSICSLTSLRKLYLGFNYLEGEMPSCPLGSLEKLETLFLSNNMLSGQLPSLSNLKSLQLLWLDDNLLSGDISSAFGNMPALQAIFLEDNNFEGHIDDGFLRQSTGLIQLDVSDNRLEGSLPGYFFDANEFSYLELMDWHGNKLSGSLPDITSENRNLQFIALYKNQFTGSVPPSWGTYLTELFHLDISRNNMSLEMPAAIGDMRKLKRLFMGGNNWSRGAVPTWLAKLTDLRELSLKNSGRTGPFLMDTLVHLRQLVFLDLDNNDLTGPIPTFLSQLTNLQFLLLNRNRITGTIPSSIGALTNLRAAFFEGNNFEGTMDPICNLPNFLTDTDSDEGVVVADCSGGVECSCCTLCCEASPTVATTNNDIKEARSSCHDWTGPANLNPRWEGVYNREAYVFGSQMWFDADAEDDV